MLQHTFVHAPRIGPDTEAALWRAGAKDWAAYRALYAEGDMTGARYEGLARTVEASDKALAQRDLGWFAAKLPGTEQWRLYEEFHERAAYVDIETTGLSRDGDTVTVVAMHAEGRTRTFVHQKDMDEFPAAVARFPLIVTFNGASFDLPFLAHRFRGFKPVAHIDLRHPLKRLGYSGGLKAIERAVGISRGSQIRDIDGFEAVRLWNAYRRGDKASLERLLEYARADVENLPPLARLTAEKSAAALGFKKRACRWGGW